MNEQDLRNFAAESFAEYKSLWHDGSEKPQTGRIMFESTDGGLRFADYDLERNRFDCDDECYYSGMWEHCHIKRWTYEKVLLNL